MDDSGRDNLMTDAGEDDLWVVKHKAEFWVQRTSARINNLSEAYFDIAQESFTDYLLAEKCQFLSDESDENHEKHFVVRRRYEHAAIKTIVFAAMACEAAIYDIAAIQLSDKFARNVLDKLDPVSKWLVVPRLICGKSLRDNGPAITALRSTFSARNELVHAKSISGLGVTDPAQYQRIADAARKQSKKIESGVVPAYQAVVLLSLELERLFKTSLASLPYFSSLDNSPAYRDASKEVKVVIRRCLEIDTESLKADSCSLFERATGSA